MAHLHAGGRAVLLRDGQAVLQAPTGEVQGAHVADLQARFAAAGLQVEAPAVLAAVGAAWALGISPELIIAGLDTFVPALPH
jgi:cyanophycin synthetase